jgi:hypothetical protein
MFRQYRKVEKDEQLIVAGDTSSGGLDRTAIQFLSKTKLDVPLVYHSPITTSDVLPQLSKVLDHIFDVTQIKPVVALERQNGGTFLMDRLAGMNYANKFELFKMPRKGNIDPQDSIHLGWDTTSVTRPIMLQELKDVIDKTALTIYDKPTITELYSFVVIQTSTIWKAQAEQGAHDDLVMSLAIAWQMCQNVQAPIPVAELLADLPDDTKLFEEGGFY